jgi:predicted enzyme related to lactoylglutathione lyase
MMYCTDPDGARVELMQAPGERQRFSHSGVCMDDVEHFLAFYRGLAGFERAEDYELYDHGYFMNVINELDDVKLRAQMIRNGNRDTIELLEMKSPAGFGSREPLPANQYGFRYLALETGDIGKTAAAIRGLGGRTFDETLGESDRAKLMFCADPIGARLLLTPAKWGSGPAFRRQGREFREQYVEIDRLGDVVVHAGGAQLVLGVDVGLGGERDDRDELLGPSHVADVAGGLDAIHFRHLHIHQNDIIIRILHRLDRLDAVLGDVDQIAGPRQKLLRQYLIELDVFREKDAEGGFGIGGH